MKLSTSKLAILAALSLPAFAAVAQQATQGGGDGQRGPSAEMMSRMQDGKLAGAKAMLRLTPEQEKLWGPVEEQVRASFAERAKMRAEHQARRAERQAAGENKAAGEGKGEGRGRGKMALPDRLDNATEMMTKRADRLKAFSAAVKPLYASLSDEQKLVANQVLGSFASGGKGRHGGWGGHHAGRHHGGWGGKHADGADRGWGRHGGRHHGGGRPMHDMQGQGGPDQGGATTGGSADDKPAGDKQ